MERLLGLVKRRKWEMLIYWIIVVLLLSMFGAKIFCVSITKLKIIFAIGIAIITYMTLILTMQYTLSQKKLKWVNSIYDQFMHMQIFIDNNNLVLEILEGEMDKLEQYAIPKSFKLERISNKNDLVKVLVK